MRITEVGREDATIGMLAAVAMAASIGRRIRHRIRGLGQYDL